MGWGSSQQILAVPVLVNHLCNRGDIPCGKLERRTVEEAGHDRQRGFGMDVDEQLVRAPRMADEQLRLGVAGHAADPADLVQIW